MKFPVVNRKLKIVQHVKAGMGMVAVKLFVKYLAAITDSRLKIG